MERCRLGDVVEGDVVTVSEREPHEWFAVASTTLSRMGVVELYDRQGERRRVGGALSLVTQHPDSNNRVGTLFRSVDLINDAKALHAEATQAVRRSATMNLFGEQEPASVESYQRGSLMLWPKKGSSAERVLETIETRPAGFPIGELHRLLGDTAGEAIAELIETRWIERDGPVARLTVGGVSCIRLTRDQAWQKALHGGRTGMSA